MSIYKISLVSQLLLYAIAMTVFFGCSEINFELPQGPQGPQGMSAYELWKEGVENGTITWPKDKVEVEDFMVYIKGEKGDKGEDGKSAYELWKVLISSGEVANPHNPKEKWNKDRNTESDFWDFLTGRDGVSPHIGDNGNWWIGYVDTKVPARGQDGKDGITPHIGQNGNWWIGITDTQVPAKGQDGVSPHIGDNGNWWIGTVDTKVPARGQDGKDGISAYESWKQLAVTGDLDDPKQPGVKWPNDKVEVEHFIQYLTGANGKDGINGKDGADGQTPYIGSNGNWWIGTVDTKVPAKGQDGKDGIDGYTPYVGDNGNWFIDGVDTGKPSRGDNGKDGTSPHIGDNGNWWIGTTDTGKPSRGDNGQNGQNGVSPHIGDNGNWWIGTTDTQVPAKGQDGNDGQNGVSPQIGDNGNWWIGTTDTGVPARGENGLSGVDGKSAYELWVEDVKKGVITDPDTGAAWSTTEITQADFWRYLKGKDGKDGETGKNGVDGKSAYEIWEEMAKTGTLNDPKNPGQKWDSSKTTETDFWLFLMGKDGKDGEQGINGKDGQSAYQLWVEEVGKGLQNPHDENGGDWPKDRTTTNDFWKFLSGKDGQDGSEGRPGEPGSPGESVILVKGIPNVIAQYALQERSEYVRWSDGAVLYVVYNDVGQPAAGAKVKGLPSVKDPNIEYEADAEGKFLVPKEQLPEGKPISELVGQTASVTYLKSTGERLTETSAKNTYVPNRIHIRLVKRQDHQLDRTTVNVLIETQRNIGTPDAVWEKVPDYLGNLVQNFKAYELRDKNDPTSFDRNSTPYYSKNQGISSPTIKLNRPNIKPDYMLKVGNEWDGKENYYMVEMSSYYGEDAMLNAVIRTAPRQFAPIISRIEQVTNYSEKLNTIGSMTVEFDVSKIDPNLIYSGYILSETKAINGIDYEYWNPVSDTDIKNQKILGVEFKFMLETGSVIANNSENRATLNNSKSEIRNVHASSDVSISLSDLRLLGVPESIGVLQYNKETNTLDFVGVKSSTMVIPDILGIPIGN